MNLTRLLNEQQLEAIRFEGEPVFIARQVCDVLGIHNPAVFTKDLNDRQKIVLEGRDLKAFKALANCSVTTVSPRAASLIILTEEGAYKALLRSRKPKAGKIQTWIADEVFRTGLTPTP